MSFATPMTKSSSGSEPVLVNRLASPTRIGIASPGDEQFVREVGAAEFVPRGDGAFAAVHEHAPGGADAVIDAAVIGAPVLEAVRDGGRVAAVRPFKGESERGMAIDLVSVRTYLDRADRLEALLDRAARGGLRLRVVETFPPERAAEAHLLLEAGGLRGRPVIVF